MNPRIFQAFRDREAQITQYIVGCGKRYGGECTCDPENCPCSDCGVGCRSESGVNPAPVPSAAGCCSSKSHGTVVHSQHEHLREKDEMGMTSEQISKHLTATAIAASSGKAGSVSRSDSINSTLGRRRYSTQSENTFGRNLSGLSALSIDWENMDDFDVDVDHSAHINNDLSGTHVRCGGKIAGEDLADGIMGVSNLTLVTLCCKGNGV